MKKKLILIGALLTILTVISYSADQKNTCVIKGKTIGVKSKSILLLRANEDFRSDGIEIPIKDNTFEYILNVNQPEGYRLMLGEARMEGGRYQIFFVEQGEIHLTVYPESEFEKNLVIGGQLNKEYKIYIDKEKSIFTQVAKPVSDSLGILFKSGNYFSDTMKILQNELRIGTNNEKVLIRDKMKRLRESGKDLSDLAKVLEKKQNEITQNYFDRQLEYVRNNLSIVSYFLLFDVLDRFRHKVDLIVATNCYKKLFNKYTNHPYNILIGNMLESLKSIRVGGKYIDFSAPDLNGEVIELSDLVRGRVALIDLWSTWCAPCIARSRTYVPVYEEFKGKGFVIVGVVADKERNGIIKSTEKEKHPWKTLIEVDKNNKIWEKYGISNAGGNSYLIDNEGSIVAIDPSADDVRKILSENLK